MRIKIKNKNKYFNIDKNDLPILLNRSPHLHCSGNNQYIRLYLKEKKRQYYLHRLIMNLFDKKLDIDHIDGNGLNNRKSNLRICCRTLNNMNRKKVSGIYFCKLTNKWRTDIFFKNKRYFLGRFDTKQEARNAYLTKKASFFDLLRAQNDINPEDHYWRNQDFRPKRRPSGDEAPSPKPPRKRSRRSNKTT